VYRFWPRVVRRALASALVVTALIVPGIFPRPAAAAEGSGSIYIVQSTIPEGPQDFFYDTDILSFDDFALDDDDDGTLSNQAWSEYLEPGSYVISQSLPLGWVLLGVSCTDPDGGTNTLTNGAIIDLDDGEEITCTFSNSLSTGDVAIHLETIPEDPTSFGFQGDLGTFALADDGNEIDDMTWNTITVSGLLPGTYHVDQLTVAGFDLTSISCGDPDGGTTTDLVDREVTLDVDAGDVIDCTFTNESTAPPPPPPPGGDFHVVLDAIPDNAVDVPFTAEQLPFSLDDDPSDGALSNQFDRYDMDLGPWDVQATIPTGWQVKTIACSDPDNGSTTSAANARAVIDLDDGEDVTCTFTIEPKPVAPPQATKCNGKDATIVAAAGATAVRGTQGADVIVALNGNVRVDARGGNDTICAGAGDNIINGGAGDDWIDGGAGTNTIDLGAGTNTAFAGPGADTIVGSSGNDTVNAGDGNNLVSLAGGNDQIVTGSGDDRISGGKGFDTCQPGGGTNAVRDCEA